MSIKRNHTQELVQKLHQVKQKVELIKNFKCSNQKQEQLSSSSINQQLNYIISNELSYFFQYITQQFLKLSAHYQTKIQYQSLSYEQQISQMKQQIQRQYKVIGLMKLQLEELVILVNERSSNRINNNNNNNSMNGQRSQFSADNNDRQQMRRQQMRNREQQEYGQQEQSGQYRIKKVEHMSSEYEIQRDYKEQRRLISGLEVIAEEETERTLMSICEEQLLEYEQNSQNYQNNSANQRQECQNGSPTNVDYNAINNGNDYEGEDIVYRDGSAVKDEAINSSMYHSPTHQNSYGQIFQNPHNFNNSNHVNLSQSKSPSAHNNFSGNKKTYPTSNKCQNYQNLFKHNTFNNSHPQSSNLVPSGQDPISQKFNTHFMLIQQQQDEISTQKIMQNEHTQRASPKQNQSHPNKHITKSYIYYNQNKKYYEDYQARTKQYQHNQQALNLKNSSQQPDNQIHINSKARNQKTNDPNTNNHRSNNLQTNQQVFMTPYQTKQSSSIYIQKQQKLFVSLKSGTSSKLQNLTQYNEESDQNNNMHENDSYQKDNKKQKSEQFLKEFKKSFIQHYYNKLNGLNKFEDINRGNEVQRHQRITKIEENKENKQARPTNKKVIMGQTNTRKMKNEINAVSKSLKVNETMLRDEFEEPSRYIRKESTQCINYRNKDKLENKQKDKSMMSILQMIALQNNVRNGDINLAKSEGKKKKSVEIKENEKQKKEKYDQVMNIESKQGCNKKYNTKQKSGFQKNKSKAYNDKDFTQKHSILHMNTQKRNSHHENGYYIAQDENKYSNKNNRDEYEIGQQENQNKRNKSPDFYPQNDQNYNYSGSGQQSSSQFQQTQYCLTSHNQRNTPQLQKTNAYKEFSQFYTNSNSDHNRQLRSLQTTFGRQSSTQFLKQPLSEITNRTNNTQNDDFMMKMLQQNMKSNQHNKILVVNNKKIKNNPNLSINNNQTVYDNSNNTNKQNLKALRKFSYNTSSSGVILPPHLINLSKFKNSKSSVQQSSSKHNNKINKSKKVVTQESINSMIQNHMQTNNKFLVGNKKQQLKYDGEKITVSSNNGVLSTIRQGHGVLYYSNGLIYDGQFINNKRQGFGILKFNHVQLYAGQWKDDQLSGQGKIRNCAIINKKKKQMQMTCQGSENGNNNGYSNCKTENNFTQNNIFWKWISYCGQFKKNRFEGEGTLYLQGGQKFVGKFMYGAVEGQGSFYKKNGQVQNGIWRNNMLLQRLETQWN